MKLSELKQILPTLDHVKFQLENGDFVPEHSHVTEVGMISKKFIDCGGEIRKENVVSLQLWNADDFDHRLKPIKLLNIIQLSEKKLSLENLEIEVEYQNTTIGKYDLDFNGKHFVLKNKITACLALEDCGISTENIKENLTVKPGNQTVCTPNSGCC